MQRTTDRAILLVGHGNMGRAVTDGWRQAGIALDRISIVTRGDSRTKLTHLEPEPRVIVLATKPSQFAEVAPELSRLANAQCTVVSLLAGMEIATLRHHLPHSGAIIRAMPNIAARIRRSSTLVFAASDTSRNDRDDVEALLAAIGTVDWLEDERQMHVATALAGSGPAFFLTFQQNLAEAARVRGLPGDLASRLSASVFAATAEMAARDEGSAAALCVQIASPGGTTQAGLNVLAPLLSRLADQTIGAAADRSLEIAAALAATPPECVRPSDASSESINR